MKKLVYGLSLILMLGILLYSHPLTVAGEAKTLQELYNNLNTIEAELKAKQNDKNLTADKINKIKDDMVKTGLDIQTTQNDISTLKEEITNLNNDIVKKNNEIKKIMNYVQLTNGENIYLEYIFGAENLTDFIYRMSISEQITEYNDKLIKDMNKAIEDKNNKTKEMNDKLVTLEKKQKELVAEQTELGNKMNVLDENMIDINDEIKMAKDAIKTYESLGCKLNDLLDDCIKAASDKVFLRPLVSGVITSDYALRYHPTKHIYQWHYAYDIGGNSMGTSVYSAAAGTVMAISRPATPNIAGSSCGGNMVVIQHFVNGKFYATRYLHLHTVNVSNGQAVTADTVIGTVGGGESYDACTTGPHLDFSIANGRYGIDFWTFREPYTFPARNVINFPAFGVRFYNRYQMF